MDRLRFGFLVLALIAALFAGCADGPIPETKYLNPWARKQWAEDEQRVTTFHRKVADLAELRKKAPQMSAAERDDTATNLAARLREEKSSVLRAEFVRTLAAFTTPDHFPRSARRVSPSSPRARSSRPCGNRSPGLAPH